MLDIVLLRLKQRGGVFVNGDGIDLITLRNFIHNLLACNHFAEDSVLAIEVGSRKVGDEKLAAVGVGSGIGHGENSRLGVLERTINFIRKPVSRTTRTRASWIATLDHEIRNHAVKCHAVIVTALGKIEEIRGGDRDLRSEKPGIDVASAGVKCDFDVRHDRETTQERRFLQPKLERTIRVLRVL